MRQFAVIGLGNFGHNCALRLAQVGHQVLAIDMDEARIEAIKDQVTQAVVADTRDKAVLSEYVSSAVDAAVVSLGDHVEASLLAVLYLRELGIKHIVAKASSDDHGKILESIGATDVVYPERDAAVMLAEKLSADTTVLHYIALSPEYSIVDVATPDEFVGKTLKQLHLPRHHGILVIAVKNLLKNEIRLMPPAEQVLDPDSVLTVIGRYEDLAKLKL